MHKQVRPHEDDMVDRPGVEVQQCMERTGTNRPRTYLTKIRESIRKRLTFSVVVRAQALKIQW